MLLLHRLSWNFLYFWGVGALLFSTWAKFQWRRPQIPLATLILIFHHRLVRKMPQLSYTGKLPSLFSISSHLSSRNMMLKNILQVHAHTSAQHPCPHHLRHMPYPSCDPLLSIPPLGLLLAPALDDRLRNRGLCVPPAILSAPGGKPVQSHQLRHPVLLHRRRSRLPLSRHLHSPYVAD